MIARLDAPIREALALISSVPSVQHATYLLYTQRPEALNPGIRQALDHAVERSLAEAVAA